MSDRKIVLNVQRALQYCVLCLLMTLPYSPKAELRSAQLNGSVECIREAPMAFAKRP